MYRLRTACFCLVAGILVPLAARAQPPQFVCAGGPAQVPDSVNVNMHASCSTEGNQAVSSSKAINGWVINGNADAADANCSGPFILPGSAHAALSHACVGLPEGATQLVVNGEAKAMAGYHYFGSCDGGNYCGASASVSGSVATGMTIGAAQVGNYCLGVADWTQGATATAGYPGSHSFNSSLPATPVISLVNPNGQVLTLAPHATYPLNLQGNWQVLAPIGLSIASNMAENSGTYSFNESIILQVAQVNADGTCPPPQLSPAAKAKALVAAFKAVQPSKPLPHIPPAPPGCMPGHPCHTTP
jgi:hypothetical protein